MLVLPQWGRKRRGRRRKKRREHCGHKAGDSLSCQRRSLMQSSVAGSFTLPTGLSPPPLHLSFSVLHDERKRLGLEKRKFKKIKWRKKKILHKQPEYNSNERGLCLCMDMFNGGHIPNSASHLEPFDICLLRYIQASSECKWSKWTLSFAIVLRQNKWACAALQKCSLNLGLL